MKNMIIMIVAGVLINLLGAMIMAYPFMLLWNSAVVPALTVVAKVEYIQSVGILLLAYVVRAAAARVEFN